MLRKLFAGCIAGLALTATATPALAQGLDTIADRGSLRVGIDVGYMPFEMRDKRGEIIGFDIDLARAMAQAMGVELELVNTAWDGIIPALLTGKIDLIFGGMTITPQRNMRVLFSDPYLEIGQTLLVSKSRKPKLDRLQDLNDPKVVLTTKLGTTGDIAAKRHFPQARIREFESESDAALEVIQGRADAFIYDLPHNTVFAIRYPDAVWHREEPFTWEPLGLAMRLGEHDLLNWVNNFLRQVRGDGRFDRWQSYWFEDRDWLERVQ